ncbi:MAG TPA: hypothetical protein VGI59_00805 [Candidatus Udaeobacter sp.]
MFELMKGYVLHAFGQEVTILQDGERTNGRLTAWINVNPPGDGPPPHYHSIEDETFYVLEGRAACRALVISPIRQSTR